jgi:hypothetical protein
MGISVYLGMKYTEWDDAVPAARVAEIVTDMIANGIRPR